ncbi:MAG: hypothetical protein AB7C89_05940 [Intestinibacillus sp.]
MNTLIFSVILLTIFALLSFYIWRPYLLKRYWNIAAIALLAYCLFSVNNVYGLVPIQVDSDFSEVDITVYAYDAVGAIHKIPISDEARKKQYIDLVQHERIRRIPFRSYSNIPDSDISIWITQPSNLSLEIDCSADPSNTYIKYSYDGLDYAPRFFLNQSVPNQLYVLAKDDVQKAKASTLS